MGTRANFRFYINHKLPNGEIRKDFIANLFKQCDGYLWNSDIVKYLEYVKKQAKKEYINEWIEAKIMDYISKFPKIVKSKTPLALCSEHELDGWLYDFTFVPAWIVDSKRRDSYGLYSPNLHLTITNELGFGVYYGNIEHFDIQKAIETEREAYYRRNDNAF